MSFSKKLEKYKLCLSDNEKFIGHIYATIFPLKWVLFLGPLGLLFLKTYIIIVSDKKVYFHELDQLGNTSGLQFYEYDDIECLEITKGLIKYKLEFSYKGGKRLILKAQHWAFTQKIRRSLISSEALSYLKEKFHC